MSEEDRWPGGDGPRQSRGAALWRRLTAPARSEQAAFRVVLWAAGIAVAVAVIATVVRAVS